MTEPLFQHSDLDEAIACCCRVRATYAPNVALGETYDRSFAIDQDLYPAVIGLNERLTGPTQR